MVVSAAAKFQTEPLQLCQPLGAGTDAPDRLHQVPVPEGKWPLLPQITGRSQVVHQAQQLIIALVQKRGLFVQRRILLPLLGRGQLCSGQMQRPQSGAQLGGDIGKHSGKIKGICFHQRPPFAPGSFDSMYAAGVSNHGKACLEHQ